MDDIEGSHKTNTIDVEQNDIFVGRSEELKKLKSLAEEVKKGNCRTVFIAGEAGIGKTTLVNEFKHFAVNNGFSFLVGTCHGETADPYLPFKEAFNRYLEEEDYSDGSFAMMPVERSMDIEDKKMFDAEREATFYETTENVKDIARETPLAVFIDDIQWADQASLDILGYMAESIEEEPVLFIASYRPEEVKKNSPLSEMIHRMVRKKNEESIELDPLDTDDTAELVGSVLGDRVVPQDYIQLVHEKTDGNPFFVKESVRQMLEDGKIKPERKEYPTDPKDVSVPKVVQEVIERRTNNLEKASKKVLEMGSIIGEKVPFVLLNELTEADEISLLDQVDTLIENDLWKETPSGDSFKFHHQIIRDTVYEGLKDVKKRLMHSKVGETIEDVYSDEPEQRYTELAHHFHRAQEHTKAIRYYSKAGEKAENMFAQEDAIEMYGKAVEIADKASMEDIETDTVELLEKRADASKIIGEYGEALSHYRKAVDNEGEPSKKADIHRKIAEVYKKEGEFEKALEECEIGLKKVRDQNTEEKAHLLGAKGTLHTALGNYEEAMDILEKRMSVSEELDGKEEIAQAHHDMGSVFIRKSDYESALDHLKEALDLWDKIDDETGYGASLHNVAVVHYYMGDLDKALENYKESMKIDRKMGKKRGIAIGYQNMAMIYEDRGEYDEALRYNKESLDIFRRVGDKDGLARVLGGIGSLHSSKGELEEAFENFEEALEVCREIGDRNELAIKLENIGEIYRMWGELDEALEYLRKSLKIRQEIGNGYGIGRAVNQIGVIYRAKRELEKAVDHHLNGLEKVRETQNRKGIATLLIDLAETYLKKDNVDKAEETVEEALKISKDIEAKALIGECKKIMGTVHRKGEELDEAEKELQRSRDILADIDKISYSKSLYEHGLLMKEKGSRSKALEYLREAHQSFHDMGMDIWEERVKDRIEELEVGE